MNTVEVLVKAKEIIQDHNKWMQGNYTNGDRTCFCALGAIGEVTCKAENGFTYYAEASNTKAAKLLRKVVDVELTADGYTSSVTFAPFNDNHTHAEVMEAFDKAIQLAQAEEV